MRIEGWDTTLLDHLSSLRTYNLLKNERNVKKKLCKLETYGKNVQVEAQQKRQKEKQGTLEEMKIRKRQGGNMDSILDKKDS